MSLIIIIKKLCFSLIFQSLSLGMDNEIHLNYGSDIKCNTNPSSYNKKYYVFKYIL